jgi:hypothetical protein
MPQRLARPFHARYDACASSHEVVTMPLAFHDRNHAA